MLGVSGTADDTPLVSRLGLLEELTLYSLVAISNLQPGKSEQAIFALAQQVDGWGRIHAFYRLADTTDPNIKDWMLRGGFANKIMDEEIAHIAATIGGLADALQAKSMVSCSTGPAGSSSPWRWAALPRTCPTTQTARPPLTPTLNLVDTATRTLLRLQHLYDLERYLTGWATDNPHLREYVRVDLAGRATNILNRPGWAPLVAAALDSDDVASAKNVLGLAPQFDLDPIRVVFQWLPREPHDAYLWQTILDAADRDDIKALVELAGRILPCAAIKTGPAKDLGIRLDYQAERCLDQILQQLQKFPGEGWEAIALGLTSRVTRNRNMALRALAEWPRDKWPNGAQEALNRLLFQEPDDGVRRRTKDLLGKTE